MNFRKFWNIKKLDFGLILIIDNLSKQFPFSRSWECRLSSLRVRGDITFLYLTARLWRQHECVPTNIDVLNFCCRLTVIQLVLRDTKRGEEFIITKKRKKVMMLKAQSTSNQILQIKKRSLRKYLQYVLKH